MCYRIPYRVFAAGLGSLFALVAQTSVTHGAKIQDPKAVTEAARALVLEEARAVQSIDHFEVSHQVDITSVMPHYNQTTHAYIKTWVLRPAHIRAESQQYMHNETIVSDGSTTWVYNGGDKKYWKRPGGAPAALFSNAFPGLARQLSSANLPSVMTSAKLVGKEPLTIAGRDYPCDIVDVRLVPSASNGTLEENKLRLWVSREYKVPLKMETTFVGVTPESRKKYSDYVTDFGPNINIPESIWTFNPPSDATRREGTTSERRKQALAHR
jgi:outer membrane lipoprotein-sorting protein